MSNRIVSYIFGSACSSRAGTGSDGIINGGTLVDPDIDCCGVMNSVVCYVIVVYRLTMAIFVSIAGCLFSYIYSDDIPLAASLTAVGITGSVRVGLNGSKYLGCYSGDA